MSDGSAGTPTIEYSEPQGPIASLTGLSPRERRVLDDVNRRVAARSSLNDLLDFVFESTGELWPTDRLSLAFVEDDSRRVVAHHTRATYEPLALKPGYAEDLQGSSLERVVRQGKPRIINDLERYGIEHPNSVSTKLVVSEGLRSSMTCPLYVEGRPVGLLFRSSRHPRAYVERHLRRHEFVAERLGQAVELAYRIEQLAETNRAYTEVLGFVSHELKSPIASIVTDGRLFLEGYLGDLSEQQSERLGRMVAKGEYLLDLVREYLDLARIESGEINPSMKPHTDLLAEVIEPALEIVEAHREQAGMKIERAIASPAPAITCDPSLMKIVLVNLLSNAIKYGNAGGVVRITLEPSDGGAELTVWNEGPGFPESQRHRLFRRFSRLNTPELKKRQGTGVGLYSTWRIVQLHRGRITARSEQGAWAAFTVRLPLRQPIPVDAGE